MVSFVIPQTLEEKKKVDTFLFILEFSDLHKNFSSVYDNG